MLAQFTNYLHLKLDWQRPSLTLSPNTTLTLEGFGKHPPSLIVGLSFQKKIDWRLTWDGVLFLFHNFEFCWKFQFKFSLTDFSIELIKVCQEYSIWQKSNFQLKLFKNFELIMIIHLLSAVVIYTYICYYFYTAFECRFLFIIIFLSTFWIFVDKLYFIPIQISY